jgi:hypothetical protein
MSLPSLAAKQCGRQHVLRLPFESLEFHLDSAFHFLHGISARECDRVVDIVRLRGLQEDASMETEGELDDGFHETAQLEL